MSTRAELVDLTYANDLLSGLIGAHELRLPIDVPVSTSWARGTYGDAGIDARWRIGSNYEATEVPAVLEATLGGETVNLSTSFSLQGKNDPTLVGATLVGEMGTDAIVARVSPRGHNNTSVSVDGHWGDASVTIVAVASIDLTEAGIRGTIGGQPIALLAEQSRPGDGTIRIRGRSPGPAGLTLLIAVGLLYFL